MLIVRSGGQEEFILESNYEKYEELNGTALQISFDSFDSEKNFGHSLIVPNVSVIDEDGQEYKVKQLTNTPYGKKVNAVHLYYDLIGFRKNEQFIGNRSFNEYANWLFNNSGWTFRNINVFRNYNFNNFGSDNFIALVQRLITGFDCEMRILPNKVIEFANRIGVREDKQYRFGNNIKEISESIDTSNVRTSIEARGADSLVTQYLSPLASNALFGVLFADPVEDRNITTIEELQAFARRSLNDVPEISIEASVLDTDGNVGDYVWVIHEELGIEMESRILSKTTRRDYQESTVEVGNSVRRTLEDALIEQKSEIKENKEIAQKATDELEQKTEEDLAIITDGLTEIRLDVRNTENTLRSEIIQTADRIELRVNDNDLRIAELNITADRIQSNVTNLENSTNSSITQLSNNINLKVDVGGTISDINLSQGAATINADKINLNGAVIVNGNISGSTDITVQRNAAIGNALYFGGQQGSFDFIEISGGDMTFNSFGDFMFSGGNLFVNGRRVLTE